MKRRINRRDLWRMFLRSFLVQGSWNYKSMLGLGFCFCALPVLRKVCKTQQERQAFIRRHLDFFNAHPYFASWCLGAVAKLEEEAVRKKWPDYRPISVFKERLAGPLGAIGDELFWNGIKPAVAGLAVWIAIVFGWIAVVVFLLVYNIPHLYIRWKGIFAGYQAGFDIVSALSVRRFQDSLTRIAISGAVISGLCTAAGLTWTASKNLLYVPIFIMSAVLAVVLLKFKRSINFILIVAAIFSLGLSVILL